MKNILGLRLACLLFVACFQVSLAIGQVSNHVPHDEKLSSSVISQEPSGTTGTTKNTKNWQLKINKNDTATVELHAETAPLAALAADLSQQLNVPVHLSPVMQKQTVAIQLKDVSLETLLRALAPDVSVDETINFPDNRDDQLLGVHLSGINEAPLARDANVKNSSETFMFMGNLSEDEKADLPVTAPLVVKIETGRLTIQAHQQPVSLVLYEIAQQLGIPFSLEEDVNKLVELDLQDYRIEEALQQLGVPVKLIRRRNLSRDENEPLRLVLPPAISPKQIR